MAHNQSAAKTYRARMIFKMNFFKIKIQPCISRMEKAVLYISESKLCTKMIFQKFVLAAGHHHFPLLLRQIIIAV